MKRKALILLFLIVFSMSMVRVKAQSGTTSVDSNTFFGFNNGWLNFTEPQTFQNVTLSGNTWYFDAYSVSLDGANCTLHNWFNNDTTTLNLTSISGTCTIILNIGEYYASVFGNVTGASNYNFQPSLNVLTIQRTSFSTAIIYIYWDFVTPSGPPPGNPNPPPVNPNPPTNTTNPIPTNTTNPNPNPVNPITPGKSIVLTSPYSPDLILIGVCCILGVVGLVGYYSGTKKRNPVSQARKQWNKQRED